MEKELEKKSCYFVKERYKEPHEQFCILIQNDSFVEVSETDVRREAALWA